MNLEDVIVYIRIEERNKMRDNDEKAKEITSKANVVKNNLQAPQHNKKLHNFKPENPVIMHTNVDIKEETKMNDCGLLLNIHVSNIDKCDICVESQSAKKSL